MSAWIPAPPPLSLPATTRTLPRTMTSDEETPRVERVTFANSLSVTRRPVYQTLRWMFLRVNKVLLARQPDYLATLNNKSHRPNRFICSNIASAIAFASKFFP